MALSFSAGMMVANRYNERAVLMQKDALERQYVRLVARADADDPCKPYRPAFSPSQLNEFESRLKTNGQATVQLNKKK